MNDNENKYKDIIDLPHHVSKKRPQMSMEDRAAQFSPFAALTGHDAAIRETARLTEEQVTFDEEALAVLDIKLRMLLEYPGTLPEVEITYFEPDTSKSGGAYITVRGFIKKIDTTEKKIVLRDNTMIPIDLIANFESELFPTY